MLQKLLLLPALLLVWMFHSPVHSGHRVMGARNPPGRDSIRCFSVQYRFPIINGQGKVDSFHTMTSLIFLAGNLTMYVHYYHISYKDKDHVVRSMDRQKYFVFEKDSSSGILYLTPGPIAPSHFPVASEKLESIPELRIAGFEEGGSARLVSTAQDPASGWLKKIYCNIGKGPVWNKDTCYLYYSDRMKNIPASISFSRTMDKAQQMKLCAIKAVFAPHFEKIYNATVDRVEYDWNLEELSVFNRDSAQLYFTKYQADARAGRWR